MVNVEIGMFKVLTSNNNTAELTSTVAGLKLKLLYMQLPRPSVW